MCFHFKYFISRVEIFRSNFLSVCFSPLDIIFCLRDRNCSLSVILRRVQFSISSIVFLRWQPVPTLSRSSPRRPSSRADRVRASIRKLVAPIYRQRLILRAIRKRVSILHIPAYDSSFGGGYPGIFPAQAVATPGHSRTSDNVTLLRLSLSLSPACAPVSRQVEGAAFYHTLLQ